MRRTLLAAALAATLATQVAGAAEIEGQRFDDSVRVGGRELMLNGLGLRSMFIVKAYVAALYVPQKSRSAQELIAQSGPRRLTLRPLTELKAERFVRAFAEGLESNHAEAQLAAMREQIAQLNAAITAIGGARRGDRIDIDFADGATRVSINGQPRGQPIAGDEFYAAILRVFLGDKPADRQLKTGLLGG